jgi:hypothetical protein
MSTSISVSRRCQTVCRDQKRKLRRRSEQYEDQNLRRENCRYVSKCRDRLKQFVIIVDHDRINNVPMIKSQEG